MPPTKYWRTLWTPSSFKWSPWGYSSCWLTFWRAHYQQFLYVTDSAVFPLPLLVKQTLLQLQFLLLCADQLGELKLQKDWTYDCMYCLVFFLYEELEQFNISNASSFLSFSQEGDVILLTGLRSSIIVQGINCVNLFIHEILLLALMVVVKADLLLPYVF